MKWIGLLAGCDGAVPYFPEPPVEVEFTGVSAAYQAAFRDRADALGRDLASCTSEPVTLDVRYAARAGEVRLDGTWERCLPELAAHEVLLDPIVPVATALARYRNRLAATHDARLATFRLAVGVEHCALVLAGQFPPDGTTFAPCADGCSPGFEGVTRIRDQRLESCVEALRAAPEPP